MASITTPVTVVAQPYNTSGNGGRKLVRLSNGWLVAAVVNGTTDIKFFVSQNNGSNWSQLCYITTTATSGVAIVSKETVVYAIYQLGVNLSMVKFDATTVSNTDLSTTIVSVETLNSQSALDKNVSLAIAPDGTLHAAWASKNSTYPNSFNIRYSKSTDGGQTWAAPTQLTGFNTSGTDNTDPTIIIRSNGYPVVIFAENNSPSYRRISCRYWNGTGFSGSTTTTGFTPIYDGGGYAQSFPSALVKKYGSNIGRIIAGWHGLDSTDTPKQNVRVAYSDDGGATWTVIGKITTGNTVDRKNVTLTEDTNGNVYAIYEDNGTIKFQVCLNGTTTFGDLTTVETGTNPSALESGAFAAVPVIYKTSTSVKFHGSFNNSPALTLTSPSDNQTLSEGSTYELAGTASDPDNGNAVTVKYAINGGTARNITSAISDGSTAIPFSKTLTFTNGRLYDGGTDVSGPLAENTTYTVSVYAVDDQGGTSTTFTRSFTVILNRPPTINLDSYNANQTGVSELETLTFSGTVTDPEADNVNLTVAFNGGAPVTLKSGAASGTAFSFSIPVSALAFGANTIVFTATDAKGASTTKALTVNKAGSLAPVKTAVVRYAITPPLGSAAEIAAWVQREAGDLTVDAAASIVGSADPENYVALTKNASVPLGDGTIVEDEFVGTVAQPGAKVALRLTFTRENTSSTAAVKKIMGGIG